jgi:hypothetical protein
VNAVVGGAGGQRKVDGVAQDRCAVDGLVNNLVW